MGNHSNHAKENNHDLDLYHESHDDDDNDDDDDGGNSLHFLILVLTASRSAGTARKWEMFGGKLAKKSGRKQWLSGLKRSEWSGEV